MKDCAASCGCPLGMDRLPPTPYPAPPHPPVPKPLMSGDPRLASKMTILPSPTPPAPPPGAPPPDPPDPLGDFSKVGIRFLPHVVIPKGPINEYQDLDYNGNPV